MGQVYEEIDFTERREVLMLKALMVWIKLRFTTQMGIKYEKDAIPCIQQLSEIDQNKKSGFISDDDAWIIEQNSVLFNAIGRMFLNEFLPKELFAAAGDSRFNASRRGSVVDIALFPMSMGGNVTDVVPMTMYINKRADVIKRYEERKLYSAKDVDVIPLLKMNIDNILTSKECKVIEEYYAKFKDDPDVLAAKDEIIARKTAEDKNLRAAMRAINAQGKKAETLKLAVTLYTLVKGKYKNGHNQVTRVTFNGPGGEPSVVPDFSNLFIIGYPINLHEIKSILEPVVDSEIKIKVGEKAGRILFTTASGMNPDDDEEMANVVTAKIFTERGLEHIFETTVGPMVSIQDIEKIREKFLQWKYQR